MLASASAAQAAIKVVYAGPPSRSPVGIGRTFAYQLLAKKRIPSFTIGKLRRVRKADVDRYVEERLSAEE